MKAIPRKRKDTHFEMPHKLLTQSLNDYFWSPDLSKMFSSKLEGLKAVAQHYPGEHIVIREETYISGGYGKKATCEETFTIYEITE